MRWSLSLALTGALVGCSLDETTSTITAESACFGPNCPGNSNILCAITPCELSANPNESQGGWSLDPTHIRIVYDGGTVTPLTAFHVEGANLHALRLGAPISQPWDFVGSTFRTIFRARHKDGTEVDFRLTGFTPVDYYKTPPLDAFPQLWAYQVEYQQVTGLGGDYRWHQACPYAMYDDYGLTSDYAFFWAGDRYDPDTAEIYQSGPATLAWFNISCAGEAGPKMLRARAGEAVNPASTPAQRNGTLKMMLAKYCSNSNERFTVLGTDIHWKDKLHSNVLPKTAEVEAIWDEHGAVCLTTPRLPTTVVDELPCDLEACSPIALATWDSSYLIVSGTP